ncbi:MAG: 4-phosphoerythronate dehydrogenase [Cocleimonas sp.]
MNISADENIPYATEAFSTLGKVTLINGRTLSPKALKNTDILLVRSVTKVNQALLQNTPVKFIASATAGFNHIDLDYLKTNNIGFARAPGSNAISAAEYVIAAISLWSLKKNKNLSTLSIGIIGCGNVGSRVKRLCEDLGITCIVNDPPLETSGAYDFSFSSLKDALACDIVTLHTPLTADGEHPTFRLINQQAIDSLKAGTLFINAARGEVVEEPSLLKRMNNKNDLTLILDVWENEPKISLDMLKHTLIGTPHIAGYSIDGKVRGTEMIYKAVCDYLGEPAKWSATQVDFGNNLSTKVILSTDKDKRTEVLESYNIRLDNNDLKNILLDTSLQDGQYFDSLRKNYPARREYSELD